MCTRSTLLQPYEVTKRSNQYLELHFLARIMKTRFSSSFRLFIFFFIEEARVIINVTFYFEIMTLDVCLIMILYSDWLTAHHVLFLKQLHYSIKLFIHDNTWSHTKSAQVN